MAADDTRRPAGALPAHRAHGDQPPHGTRANQGPHRGEHDPTAQADPHRWPGHSSPRSSNGPRVPASPGTRDPRRPQRTRGSRKPQWFNRVEPPGRRGRSSGGAVVSPRGERLLREPVGVRGLCGQAIVRRSCVIPAELLRRVAVPAAPQSGTGTSAARDRDGARHSGRRAMVAVRRPAGPPEGSRARDPYLVGAPRRIIDVGQHAAHGRRGQLAREALAGWRASSTSRMLFASWATGRRRDWFG